MKNKLFILLIIVFGSVLPLLAQQDPMYTQYMFNMLPMNPAYAGSRDVLSMTALYRYQWANIEGAPRTFSFSADMPIKKEKIGLGLTVNNDNIGVFNTTNVNGIFSYRIRFRKTTLAFGIQGGFQQYQASFSTVQTKSNGSSDDAFSSNISKTLPLIGAGVYYSGDKFYVGFSLPNMLNNDLTELTNGQPSVGFFKAQQFKHFFAMAGYVFTLSPDLKLKPSAMLKYVVNAPLQIDVNANLWLYDKFGGGLSYRSGDAFSVLLEFQATDQLRFGYAYDWSNTVVNSYTWGSHEIMIRYELGYNKSKVLSPRYF